MRLTPSKLFALPALALLAGTGCDFLGAVIGGAGLAGGMVLGTLGGGDYVYDAGTSVVCLGTDAEVAESETYEFSGMVIAVDAQPEAGWDDTVGCWTEPNQVLVVQDDDGAIWRVGYAWLESDWDSTPWIDVARGTHVDVLVRADTTPGSDAAGFVVYDEEGRLAYALESGINGQGLIDGDIDGLVVTQDTDIGTTQGSCGARNDMRIDFESGTDRLALGPGGDAGMEVDGEYMTTCNIDSFSWADAAGCEEPAETSWVMF